jgi:hypothetical protein
MIRADGEVRPPATCRDAGAPVRYMLGQAVLCDRHAEILEAADARPRVGEWQGRRWLGVPSLKVA